MSPESAPTPRSDRPSETELARTARLLRAALDDPRFDVDYLRWQYDENPVGPAVEANETQNNERTAHVANLPMQYRSPDSEAKFLQMLNVATRAGQRGEGRFVLHGREALRIGADRGYAGVLGVPNKQSTPTLVKYLNARLLGQLPLRVVVPRVSGARGYESAPAREMIDDASFLELAAGLDLPPSEGWTHRWTADSLAWRLSRPDGDYAVHVGEELVVISTRASAFGVHAALVLKLLPRIGKPSEESVREAFAQVAQYHTTRMVAYAGWNERIVVRGAPPPKWLRPRPLNLIYISLDPSVPAESFSLATYEFLDFDAY